MSTKTDKPKKTSSKTAKEEKTEKPEKKEDNSLAALEAKLKECNVKVAQLEEQMRETEAIIVKIVQRSYNTLHGIKSDAEDSKEDQKEAVKGFDTVQAKEKKLVEDWLMVLGQQQALVQQVRMAVCKEAEAQMKKNQKFTLGTHTSQLLSQTTLSSADDQGINWNTFNQTLNLADLGEWKKAKPIGVAGAGEAYSTVYGVQYRGHSFAAKEYGPEFPAEDAAFMLANFKKLSGIRAPPLLNYVSISEDGKVVLVERAKKGSLVQNTIGLLFERKVKIARGLAIALNFLHDNKKDGQADPILHGRLKPSNVMLTSDDKIKLGDYGRTSRLPKALWKSYAPYMAPELLASETAPVTPATDIYAFGMVLFYLFTNAEPFGGAAPEKIATECKETGSKNPVHVALDQSENLPNALKSLIKDCTTADPAKRLSFVFMLKMQKLFEKILSEYLDMTRGQASNCWDGDAETLSWSTFANNWATQFQPLTEQQQLMLRILLDTKLDGETNVSREKFFRFLFWFGPVTKKTLPNVWAYITALLQKYKWFHGEISADEAKNRLRYNKDAPNDSKKYLENTYLVRLNTGSEGKNPELPFFLCWRKDGTKYEYGFKPTIGTDPQNDITRAFQAKKLPELTIAEYGRPAVYDRPFSTKQVNKGGGYRTDNSHLPAIDIDAS